MSFGSLEFHVQDVSYWASLSSTIGRSVDHVLTDPPYPEHVQGGGKMLSVTVGRTGGNVVQAGFDPLTSLGFIRPLVALARRWSLFHCALESLGDYRSEWPEAHVRSCIYVKDRAIPQLTGDRPGSAAEGIALFHHPDGKKAWNNGGKHNVFYGTPENRKVAMHPTGKPLMLCMALVSALTSPGDSILDPFCGSGTYGLAAYALGRHYLGTDNDPKCIVNAQARMSRFDPAKALEAFAIYSDKARLIRPEVYDG